MNVDPSIYDPFVYGPFPSVDPNTDPDGYALQAFGSNLIQNGDFSQGMGSTPVGSWRTGPIPNWTTTGPAAEVIHAPYGGDPVHHIAPLPAGFYFDSLSTPGAPTISQTFTPLAFASGVHEVIQVAFENIGGQTTSAHDTLHITLGGASLDISVNDFKDAQGHIDYNHPHQFVLDTQVLDPAHPEKLIYQDPITTTVHEIGPDAAHGNVGFAVTGIAAYSTILTPFEMPI